MISRHERRQASLQTLGRYARHCGHEPDKRDDEGVASEAQMPQPPHGVMPLAYAVERCREANRKYDVPGR